MTTTEAFKKAWIEMKPGTSNAYKLISDPGHAWLEVTRDEITRLGIADKISGYSYQNGVHCYLEEDCDLAAFVQAKAEADEVVEYFIDYQDPTLVRNFNNYQPCNCAGCSGIPF
jgi:hypothetical protein